MTVDEEGGSPAKRPKGLELIDFETRKDMFLGQKVSQELKDFMVEEYLSTKEQERLDKQKKEEENK